MLAALLEHPADAGHDTPRRSGGIAAITPSATPRRPTEAKPQ